MSKSQASGKGLSIGLLGGTFDPIHKGHVHVARRLVRHFRLDQVWFLIARTPPHKQKGEVSHSYHRYTMAALELQPYAHLLASTLELRRKGLSYTVDTLAEVSTRWPQHRFGFIAGSDSLREIRSWKDYATLFAQHTLIFVQRPGAEVELENVSLPESVTKAFRDGTGGCDFTLEPGRSYLLDLEAPPISSTEIRKTVAQGKLPPPDSVSASVFAYIKKYRLYDED